MMCFDDFQAFIDKRGGFDGDFFTHVPDGLFEGVFGCEFLQLFCGFAEEGAAGAGEDDFLNPCGVEAKLSGYPKGGGAAGLSVFLECSEF